MNEYYLIITHKGGTQALMPVQDSGTESDYAEENKQRMLAMGDRLLDENIIESYHLVQTVGSEIKQSRDFYENK